MYNCFDFNDIKDTKEIGESHENFLFKLFKNVNIKDKRNIITA